MREEVAVNGMVCGGDRLGVLVLLSFLQIGASRILIPVATSYAGACPPAVILLLQSHAKAGSGGFGKVAGG